MWFGPAICRRKFHKFRFGGSFRAVFFNGFIVSSFNMPAQVPQFQFGGSFKVFMSLVLFMCPIMGIFRKFFFLRMHWESLGEKLNYWYSEHQRVTHFLKNCANMGPTLDTMRPKWKPNWGSRVRGGVLIRGGFPKKPPPDFFGACKKEIHIFARALFQQGADFWKPKPT